MNSQAAAERQELADALAAAGPDAPTLCTGWTARDLATHLVLRERRLDVALGFLAPVRGPFVRASGRRSGSSSSPAAGCTSGAARWE